MMIVMVIVMVMIVMVMMMMTEMMMIVMVMMLMMTEMMMIVMVIVMMMTEMMMMMTVTSSSASPSLASTWQSSDSYTSALLMHAYNTSPSSAWPASDEQLYTSSRHWMR